MKVRGAQIDLSSERLQIRGVISIHDEFACARDCFTVGVFGGGLVWLAPLARAEARLLGVCRREMELNVFALGESRGAAWTAIDASGFDRIEKLTVCFRVTILHRVPAVFVAGE